MAILYVSLFVAKNDLSPMHPHMMQEDTLSEMAKKTGGFALGALIGKGSKFGGLDIKRVYFGSVYLSTCLRRSSSGLYLVSSNWLRDYSQVCSTQATSEERRY
jgi:hypothetical protein